MTPVERVEAKVHNEKDAEFTFLTLDYSNIDQKVQNAKNLTVNFKGYGVINFSLKGAQEAISDAKNTCKMVTY